MSKTGVAVIGVGILGSRHTRVYSEQKDVDLVAVVDADEKKDRDLAAKYGIKAFSDTKEFVQTLGPKGTGQVQAVSVATPDHAHYEIVKECLVGGLDVFVEKPLAKSVEEAKSLIALAREDARVLIVNYSQRWLPEHQRVEELIHRKLLGDVSIIESHRWDAAWVPERMISWGAKTTPIHFMSSHDIDLITFWLEDKVETVQAMVRKGFLERETKNPGMIDGIVALLRFRHGVVVSLHSSWILPDSFPLAADTYLEVLGSDGALFLGGSTREMKLYKNEFAERIAFSGPATATEVNGKLEGAFTNSLRSFLEAVQTRQLEGPASAARTLHVVEIQDAIVRAAETGTTIHMKG